MTLKKTILVTLTMVLVIISMTGLVQYFWPSGEELELARAESNDLYLRSDEGVTRYKIYGDAQKPAVILIHSFNGYLESWNPNIEPLIKAGYRVVVYDLFGRGLSDRPFAEYDLGLFRTQLKNLVDALAIDRASMIGSSFGSVIASDFALHYPDRVNKLMMVGPAGWPSKEGRNPLLDLPIIGDAVFHFFGRNILLPRVEEYFVDSGLHKPEIDRWQKFAALPGFTRAALSTLRHAPVLDYTAGWAELAKLNKQVLFIWGKQDVSFPFAHTEKLPALLPYATLVAVDDAAHWVNIEQAERVNIALIRFLKN